MRTRGGLTLLETIVAIAICGVVLTALATVSTSSLRGSRDGNFKIQATQILDTVGRRIAGGHDPSLLPTSEDPIRIASDEIAATLGLHDSGANGAYEVRIRNAGALTIGTSSTVRYRVEVCYGSGDDERCVRGTTLGRIGGDA